MFYGNIIPKSEVIDLDKLYESIIVENDNLCKVIDSLNILNEFGVLLEENEDNNTNEENNNNESDNNKQSTTKQSVIGRLKGLVKKFIKFISGLVEGIKKKFNKANDDQYVKNAKAQAEKTDFEHTICKMFDMTDEFENLVKNKFISGVYELKEDFINFSAQLERLGRGQVNPENVKFNEDKLKEVLGLFDKYGGIGNCNGKNKECYVVVECTDKNQADKLITKFYENKWLIYHAVEDSHTVINQLKIFTNADGDSGEFLKGFDFEKTKQFSSYITDFTKIYNTAKKLVDDCDKVMKVNGDSFRKAESKEEQDKEEK